MYKSCKIRSDYLTLYLMLELLVGTENTLKLEIDLVSLLLDHASIISDKS